MLKTFISFITKTILFFLKNRPSNYVLDSLLKQQFNKIKEVKINEQPSLFLFVSKRLSNYRSYGYFSKEPETIEWLESVERIISPNKLSNKFMLYFLFLYKEKYQSLLELQSYIGDLPAKQKYKPYK